MHRQGSYHWQSDTWNDEAEMGTAKMADDTEGDTVEERMGIQLVQVMQDDQDALMSERGMQLE